MTAPVQRAYLVDDGDAVRTGHGDVPMAVPSLAELVQAVVGQAQRGPT